MKIRLIITLLVFGIACLSAQFEIVDPNQLYISVSVTGFVPNPGVYKMTSVSRLSDALEATAIKDAIVPSVEPGSPEEKVPDVIEAFYRDYQGLRDVAITRGGKTMRYDLLRFRRLGSIENNPLLRDGDVVFVSPIRSSVTVSGFVYFPEEYQYLEGDRLSDLLDLANGFAFNADLGNILIYRYRENMVDFDIIKLDLGKQDAADIVLMPSDRIMIPKDSELRREWKITVEGNVKSPGEYLIGEQSTLYDILLQSGGPSSRGDLGNALFMNGTDMAKEDPELERLKLLPLSEMTPLEYSYLRTRLRQMKGRYSVDIANIWATQGREDNVPLHDNDYLYVPQLLDMVYVSGQVQMPGLVPWEEGKNWKYYVDEAGGFTNNRRAGGIRIITGSSGNWVKPSAKLPLYPGDMVFVSEKVDRDLWSDFKELLIITSQLVTIYIGLNAALTK